VFSSGVEDLSAARHLSALFHACTTDRLGVSDLDLALQSLRIALPEWAFDHGADGSGG
jgi:hypothetical protein